MAYEPIEEVAEGVVLTPEQYRRVKYGEWWNYLDPEQAKEAHNANVMACASALMAKGHGPIRVLVVHGSSRSNTEYSCAHELSNSQLLLNHGKTSTCCSGMKS